VAIVSNAHLNVVLIYLTYESAFVYALFIDINKIKLYSNGINIFDI
jgi:hypothetical protein